MKEENLDKGYSKYNHRIGGNKITDEVVDSLIAKCNDNRIKIRNLTNKLYIDLVNGHTNSNEDIKYLINKLEAENKYMLEYFELDYLLPMLTINLK